MSIFVIGIGGGGSDSGKTTLACELLGRLVNWGAVKYTRTAIYSSIIDDPNILSQEGKDTARFLYAGASSVFWVQSPPHELPEILALAVERLSYLDGIIVEGNSAIEVLSPDVVIFMSGDNPPKESAMRTLSMSHVVIFKGESPCGIPDGAKAFKSTQKDEVIEYIIGLAERKDKKPC